MKRSWYRIYVRDMLSQTMTELPDWVFRRLMQFEAIAADYGQDGLLPPVSEMAWLLRPVPEGKLEEALIAISKVGEAERTKVGWRLTHFEETQVSESYERVRRLREKRVVTDCNGENGDETPPHLISSPSVSSSGGEGVGEGDVFAAYQASYGSLTVIDADGLKELLDEHGAEWVQKCIEYAPGKPVGYLRKVLATWKKQGGPNGNGKGNHNAAILQKFVGKENASAD